MKKILQSIVDFLLFSNVFMSLCAVAQGLITFYLIGSKPIPAVLFLLFTSTLGIYNFSILIGRPKQLHKAATAREIWYFTHPRLMITLVIVSILSLAPLFFLVTMESKILLIFLAVISFCYSLPLFTLGGKKFGLRNIPGLKQFLITLVWTMSSVLLPVMESLHAHLSTISLHNVTLLLAKRFLFIGALTMPFDIRDLFHDYNLGLKTIPVVYGEKKAYLFCQIILIGYVVLLFLFRNNGFNNDFFALTITAVLAGWLIFHSTIEKNDYYYFFYVDGVLILQYLMLLLFNSFSFKL
ncbi:UbiA family prenyltransferase [Mucilaginibacter sp.]